MKLRKATLNDAKMLFDWRNDPITRNNSIHSEEISWKQHLDRLSKSIQSTSRFLFIAENECGTSVGTCRIDIEKDANSDDFYLLSWTIAPEYRHQGIGTKMVQKLLQQQQLVGKPLKAHIKKDNVASCKLAKSCGFVESSPEWWHYSLAN